MAKVITVLSALTAEDFSYLTQVLAGERDALSKHWTEPMPAEFMKRLADCQVIAVTNEQDTLLRQAQEIDDLKAQIGRG